MPLLQHLLTKTFLQNPVDYLNLIHPNHNRSFVPLPNLLHLLVNHKRQSILVRHTMQQSLAHGNNRKFHVLGKLRRDAVLNNNYLMNLVQGLQYNLYR